MIEKLYLCDTEAAVEGIRKSCPKSFDEIISWADETVSGIICHRAHYEMEKCFIPARFDDTIWDNVPQEIASRDPEWLYALNRHSILLNLAKAYAFTKDARYRDTFISMMRSYLSCTSFSESHLNTSWRSLETGIRPENWIRSIGLFESSGAPLPEDLLSMMEASLRDHIRQLELTHRAFQRLSNWGVIQDHGLFIAGAALGDDDAVSIALDRLEEELVNSTLEDGEQWEQSPMYHIEVLHSALDTVFIAGKKGIPVSPVIADRVRRLSQALYDMTLPDGSIIPTGDSDEMNASDLIYLASYLFSMPFISIKSEENWWDLGNDAADAAGLERKSMLHKTSGNVFLRSGSLTVHMISGLMGSGHGHISPLHVDIAEEGRVIITDCGRYTYTESAERTALKDGRSHNIFMIDGAIPEKAVGSWGYDAIYGKTLDAVISGGAYEAASGFYLGYLSSGIIGCRKLVRIEDKVVVVIDEILGDEGSEHSYEGLWHIHPSFSLSDDMRISDGNISLYVASTAVPRVGRYSYSPAYNVMEEGQMVSFGCNVRGMGSVATVFSMGDRADVSPLGVDLVDSGRQLFCTEAISLSIKLGDREWIVLSRSHEITSQVDILRSGFLEGYGRLLVKERTEKHPTRLM